MTKKKKFPCVSPLWLFSHDGKVRILNFNSKCAFWITQCTHDQSNCKFWITQCTHEWPNFGFCIPAGEECLGTLPIKHAFRILIRNAHFELRSVHTIKVIANFELRSEHTSDRILDFGFQREKNVWVPCQSNMHGARISCASVHMQRAV